MNIEGNKVVWGNDKIAVTDTIRGYAVYKHITTKNSDGTAFRFWSCIECFDDLDVAIEYVKSQI